MEIIGAHSSGADQRLFEDEIEGHCTARFSELSSVINTIQIGYLHYN
jgi:hypothetical protein